MATHTIHLGGMSGESGATMAEAITPSIVCDASASHFMGVLARHPVLMARVTMMMARQISKLEETIERLSQHSGKGRVAAVLVDMVEAADAGAETGLVPLNQVQIAKMAGLTREGSHVPLPLSETTGSCPAVARSWCLTWLGSGWPRRTSGSPSRDLTWAPARKCARLLSRSGC